MKTVELWRDFDYHPHPRLTVRFHAHCTYARVLELAARQIERAGAGRIVDISRHIDVIDAGHVFRKKENRP